MAFHKKNEMIHILSECEKKKNLRFLSAANVVFSFENHENKCGSFLSPKKVIIITQIL